MDFQQYMEKRFLIATILNAIDDLHTKKVKVPEATMKKLLPDAAYVTYCDAARQSMQVAISADAELWSKDRNALMREINLALNRGKISKEQKREFNLRAETLLERYHEILSMQPSDEVGFINYENSFAAPADEPFMKAQEVIEEFWLPRKRQVGEFNESQHRLYIQEESLTEFLDQLEGRAVSAGTSRAGGISASTLSLMLKMKRLQ